MAKKKKYDIIIDNKTISDMPHKERRLMELINGAEPEDEAEKQIEEAKAKKASRFGKAAKRKRSVVD